MFEYALIEKAKKHRQHIVLPEGNDERILRAADILLRRGVADLTILGDAKTISSMTSQMGLNLAGANIVSPAASVDYEDYVSTFLEMRKKKGMSRELAQDSMVDPTYFGTMMVYKGQADGMVSGAVNTTAHTIRPAFQIIKTRQGAGIMIWKRARPNSSCGPPARPSITGWFCSGPRLKARSSGAGV